MEFAPNWSGIMETKCVTARHDRSLVVCVRQVEAELVFKYSEENKYLNTLLFCKFSHLEIMEGSEIVIVGACPL